MIYFLRIYESFNFLIQLSVLLIRDLYPFAILSLFIMLSFTKQYTLMHFGINDPSDTYKNIDSQFLKLMIQTYKSNMGEVNVPVLDEEFVKNYGGDTFYANLIFMFNLFFWILQQALFIFLGTKFFASA